MNDILIPGTAVPAAIQNLNSTDAGTTVAYLCHKFFPAYIMWSKDSIQSALKKHDITPSDENVKEFMDFIGNLGNEIETFIINCCKEENFFHSDCKALAEPDETKEPSDDEKKGYAVTDNMGMLEIQRIDELDIFPDDESAVEQAVRDGVKLIPIEELPESFEHRYLGWIDTPENRAAIQAFCNRTAGKKTS